MSIHLPSWLLTLLNIAPYVLQATPLAPIAPFVAAGINAAEQIPGATGAQKLAASVAIAQAGLSAAQAAGVKIDAPTANEDIAQGVNLVVAAVNKMHGQLSTIPAQLPPAA